VKFRYLRQLELISSILCFALGASLILVDIYEDHQAEIQKEVLEDSYIEGEEAEAAREEAEATSKIVAHEKEATFESVLVESRIKRGETLERFLQRNNIKLQERRQIIQAIRKYFSPRLIMPGHRFYFRYDKNLESKESILKKITFMLSNTKKLVIISTESGGFESASPPTTLKTTLCYKHGVIDDNLYTAAVKAGLNAALVNQLIRIYSYSIDFQRALKTGDTFEVLVEKPIDEETGYEGYGEVVYATLFVAGGPLRLFRYTLDDGAIEYFNEKGEGARKALLKTPIKGARISSRYGKRKHPIQGYTKMHRGIDFAAPMGTPIFAAGDGVIKKMGRLRGFGNYVFIQHSQDYGTAYAHLHRYEKTITRGKSVKQGDVIGYVGMTGLATAPHLHYEIHYKGEQVNPQLVNMAPQKRLSGKELETFLQAIQTTDKTVQSLKP
jgi:murein DD-endopeptidase MepM/ murein hydrolase activator NlpD